VAADRPKPPGFDVPLGESDANIEQRFESRVIEYVERMLSEQDKNKDGYIDSEEWKAGRWSTPPESSDTNKDGRLSKLELCVRIANRYGSRDRDRDRDRNRDDDKNKSSSSSSSSGSSSDDKFRSYAEGLLKQHDKNKSGYLEKDEIAELKGNYRTADVNGDGVITVEELANKLKSYSAGSSSGSSTSSSRSSSSTSSNSGSTTPVVKRTPWWKKDTKEMAAEPVERKSYRFLSPTERLPKGLPDWFLRNDANADGQVMMVEYAATWTETAAAEFSKYDVDGDGFISPEECLAVEQLKKK
jgi:Ca2+-binding EF-hand superfamily protein